MRIAPIATAGVLALLPSQPHAAAPGGVRGKVVVVDGTAEVDPAKLVDGDEVHVYLEPTKRRPRKRPSGGTRTIRHVDDQFVPHINIVPTGTQVLFPNNDDRFHNAFSPTPADNFDLGVYNKGPGPAGGHTFDAPGAIDIYCDIHPRMWAVVKVVDSDWMARVEPDGTFVIRDVPPGTYRVVVWTRHSVEEKSEPITIGDGVVALDYVPQLQRGRAKAHTKKDGSAYSQYTR